MAVTGVRCFVITWPSLELAVLSEPGRYWSEQVCHNLAVIGVTCYVITRLRYVGAGSRA